MRILNLRTSAKKGVVVNGSYNIQAKRSTKGTMILNLRTTAKKAKHNYDSQLCFDAKIAIFFCKNLRNFKDS